MVLMFTVLVDQSSVIKGDKAHIHFLVGPAAVGLVLQINVLVLYILSYQKKLIISEFCPYNVRPTFGLIMRL